MAQVASAFPVHVPSAAEEQRILLHGVSWATYVMLRDTHESRHLRMTYLKGSLEIMSTSRQHEANKTQIARLIEMFCLERGIALYGFGHMTCQSEEKERGLEPDEWYCRDDQEKSVPDVALEVIVTHGLLDKLEVYRGLGVREVWLFEKGAFKILTLRGMSYELTTASDVFPELDIARLTHFANQPDQHKAVVGFRDELRLTTLLRAPRRRARKKP
ncbi:MAG: Uma2 family endonuclease [Kofleriaceae bacterium]